MRETNMELQGNKIQTAVLLHDELEASFFSVQVLISRIHYNKMTLRARMRNFPTVVNVYDGNYFQGYGMGDGRLQRD